VGRLLLQTPSRPTDPTALDDCAREGLPTSQDKPPLAGGESCLNALPAPCWAQSRPCLRVEPNKYNGTPTTHKKKHPPPKPNTNPTQPKQTNNKPTSNTARARDHEPRESRPIRSQQTVVRAKSEIDHTTTQITIATNPTGPHAIPHILDGIPLQTKHANLTIDPPGFAFQPPQTATP
jgi:hypothetical protein